LKFLEFNGSTQKTSVSTNSQLLQMFSTLFLFDIDGVITNPISCEVELEVISEIVGILHRGESVAFNTGRSLNWVSQYIIPPLVEKLSDRRHLSRICIVYQKGAFQVSFDDKGEIEQPIVAPDITLIPALLRQEVYQLIEARFTETMFTGEEKEAVLSPQMKPGSDYQQFKADQRYLVELLHCILEQHGWKDRFRVDPTRIATDIEDKRLGKGFGSYRILEWLSERKFQTQSFIAFGDSLSDIQMAEVIHHYGLPVDFVFVGEREQLQGLRLPIPIHLPQAHNEKGTAEYLQKWRTNRQ
jgi:hydroxymethylpyrimidine pyrophosphatase-like HAD family hydrolase